MADYDVAQAFQVIEDDTENTSTIEKSRKNRTVKPITHKGVVHLCKNMIR